MELDDFELDESALAEAEQRREQKQISLGGLPWVGKQSPATKG